jgi:hypothetical protein
MQTEGGEGGIDVLRRYLPWPSVILPFMYSRHDRINLNFRLWSLLVAVTQVCDHENHTIRREKVKRHTGPALCSCSSLAAHP